MLKRAAETPVSAAAQAWRTKTSLSSELPLFEHTPFPLWMELRPAVSAGCGWFDMVPAYEAAMRSILITALSTFILVAGQSPCAAQTKTDEPATGAPGVITQGAAGVSVGGQAAARKGDTDDQGSAIVQGSSNVFINGKPAVTVGDRTGCGGIVVGGASNVFVNGKPLARAGDLTTGCEKN
jgi:uncharacterized Zn-binding protein involved in type VI secretion